MTLELVQYQPADGILPWLDTKHLPYGVRDNHVMPWAIVRTAIFSSVTYKSESPPEFKRDTEIAAYGKVIVKARGTQLDQGDYDIFSQIIKLSLDQPVIGEVVVCKFNANRFLESIDRGGKDGPGGSDRQWLHERLKRLMDNSYTFHIPGLVDDRLHLINRITTRLGAKDLTYEVLDYTVQLDPDVLALFAGQRYSAINSSVRRALRGDALAQWLHAFYSTHSRPNNLKALEVQQLTGHGLLLDHTGNVLRNGMRTDKFLSKLKKSLQKVQEKTGWHRCALEQEDSVLVVEITTPKKRVKPDAKKAPTKSAANRASPNGTNNVGAPEILSMEEIDSALDMYLAEQDPPDTHRQGLILDKWIENIGQDRYAVALADGSTKEEALAAKAAEIAALNAIPRIKEWRADNEI